jgi:hypothetical protein
MNLDEITLTDWCPPPCHIVPPTLEEIEQFEFELEFYEAQRKEEKEALKTK